MSEERRKRQLDRDGGASDGNTKKMVTYGVVVILLAAAFIAGRYYKNHKYDNFAKCLATKQSKMYGLYWCPHCIEQKEMFGEAFHYVPYQECAIKGSSEEVPVCKMAGLHGQADRRAHPRAPVPFHCLESGKGTVSSRRRRAVPEPHPITRRRRRGAPPNSPSSSPRGTRRAPAA